MSGLILPNINCFQTQKKWLSILSNTGVLPKDVFIDLRARNFVHAITSLCARCVHARHRARNLASPVKPPERAKALLKNGTRDFQNSPLIERWACFYVTISESFKRFKYFNFETNFMENENLFQKTGVTFFS